MKVYRYELADNRSVTPYSRHGAFIECPDRNYAVRRLQNKILDKHCGDTHPDITKDTGYRFESGIHMCGCESLQSLRDWFKGFNASLLRTGFIVAVYEVDTVLYTKSGKQVAYESNKAKRLN